MKLNKTNHNTSTLTQKVLNSPLFLPILIFILALTVRLLYFSEMKRNGLFFEPMADAKVYHEWACQILATRDIIGKDAFFMNPGYPYLLALLYAFFGVKLHIIVIIQFIIGSISVILIYFIAKNIFDDQVAIISGIIASLYGVFIFYEGLLLTASWINFFNLLAILFILKATEKESKSLYLFSGILIGISSLFRPNILLFLPLLLIWLFFYSKKYIKLFFFILLGTLLILLPVIIRNYVVLKEPVISSVSSGINFYIGNGEGSDGSDEIIHKIGPLYSTPKYMWSFFKSEAENSLHKPNISYYEMDNYWKVKTFNYVKNNPLIYLKLIIKKILLFLNFQEIPNNYPYHIFKINSSILKHCFDSKYITPLALLSLIGFFNYYKTIKLNLLRTYFFIYLFTAIIIFVLSEYRLAIVPILIIFTSYSIICISKYIARRKYLKFLMSVLLTFSLYLIGNINMNLQNTIGSYHWRGIIALKTGNIEKAVFNFKKSVEIEPSALSDYFELGRIYFNNGNYQEAAIWYLKSLNINNSFEAFYSLGTIYYKLNNLNLASKYYLEAIQLDSTNGNVWNGLAIIEANKGNFREALNFWETALKYTFNPEQINQIENNMKMANSINQKVNKLD
ncbi:MAG: hypothetical protein A2252_07970 [Elusimicrobia bacterium RIFOXYA2_FULL_39_19]|nr:MAG: hypothetical protein A2252_07970 [Elusimicrobia bacterium RIFOXYA2_FULL_39_19]